jgi:sulfatase modifying factor 1
VTRLVSRSREDVAPSCRVGGPGVSECGPSKESCCLSLDVPGGAFYRSYDGTTHTDKSYPATVSSFRLDKYLVTVGRFRQFVTAVIGGWLPAQRSGKHTHLNGGQGLADRNSPGASYELGWDTAWNSHLPKTLTAWTSDVAGWLGCSSNPGTWTRSSGKNENLPVICLSIYEAYAFCIWDDGFLPSNAEYEYAYVGGSDQRVHPWSAPPTSDVIDCSYANYVSFDFQCPSCSRPCVYPPNRHIGPWGFPNTVGSESPKGDGRWGHTDLEGNAGEETLDIGPLGPRSCKSCGACVDCAYGGPEGQDFRLPGNGVRCARSP